MKVAIESLLRVVVVAGAVAVAFSFFFPLPDTPDGFWGTRAISMYSAAGGQQKAFLLRRSTDNSTLLTKFTAQQRLDTGRIKEFCGDIECLVVTAFDQSPHHRDIPQATASLQPTLFLDCLNGQPCLAYGGAHP